MIGQRSTSLAVPLAFIALLFLLASCDTFEPTAEPLPPPVAPAATAATEPPRPAPPAVVEPPPPLPKAKPAEVAAIPAQQKIEVNVAPPPPPPPEEPTAVNLIGLGEAETLELLGTPYAEREVAPAKVWDYAATGCRLEVFLYLDVASNSFHVLQYRAPGDVSGGEASQRCLKRVVDERHG